MHRIKLLLMLLFAIFVSLCGCAPSNYYNYAILKTPDGKIVKGEANWEYYAGGQYVEVTIEGQKYLTDPANVTFLSK